MNTVSTQLSNSIYLVGFVTALALKFYFAALIASGNGVGFLAKYRTQRQRYAILFIAQTIVAGAMIYALSFGTMDEYLIATNEWWSSDTLVGKVISSLATLAVLSPLLTMLCALVVYLWPAYYAKGAGGGMYYRTEDWRNRRNAQLFAINPQGIRDLANKLHQS